MVRTHIVSPHEIPRAESRQSRSKDGRTFFRETKSTVSPSLIATVNAEARLKHNDCVIVLPLLKSHECTLKQNELTHNPHFANDVRE
jgi:hypothetical protein